MAISCNQWRTVLELISKMTPLARIMAVMSATESHPRGAVRSPVAWSLTGQFDSVGPVNGGKARRLALSAPILQREAFPTPAWSPLGCLDEG